MKKWMFFLAFLFVLISVSSASAQLCAGGDCPGGGRFIVAAATSAGCGGDLVIQKCDGKWYILQTDCMKEVPMSNSANPNKLPDSNVDGKAITIAEIEPQGDIYQMLSTAFTQKAGQNSTLREDIVKTLSLKNRKGYSAEEARNFLLSMAEGITDVRQGAIARVKIYDVIMNNKALRPEFSTPTLTMAEQANVNKAIALAANATQPASISPNPAQDEVSITFPQITTEATTVELYSSTGAQLLQKRVSIGEQSVKLSVREFSQGIYYIKYRFLGQSMNSQIIVKR